MMMLLRRHEICSVVLHPRTRTCSLRSHLGGVGLEGRRESIQEVSKTQWACLSWPNNCFCNFPKGEREGGEGWYSWLERGPHRARSRARFGGRFFAHWRDDYSYYPPPLAASRSGRRYYYYYLHLLFPHHPGCSWVRLRPNTKQTPNIKRYYWSKVKVSYI